MEKPSVIGYIVFNHEGIAMRYDGKGITHKKAVHYAALMTDYWAIVKKTMNRTLKSVLMKNKENGQSNNSDCDIEYIRYRTAHGEELILTNYNEFFLVCIQKCGKIEEIE